MDVNISNVKSKESPLHIACQKHSVDIVKKLLQKGANVNAQDCEFHGYFQTPLDSLFSNYSANSYDCDTIDLLDTLISSGADVNLCDRQYNTPLHNFVQSSKPDSNPDDLNCSIIKLLLSSGVSVDCQNSSLETPLTIAVEKNIESIVLALVEEGANVNICNEQYSPLHPCLCGNE